MPIMTEPLAHLENLLAKVDADFYRATDERKRLDARLQVISEYRSEIRDALRAEKEKAGRSDDARDEG